MEEVFEFINENRTGFLATVDAEGKPHARAVGLGFIENGLLYYATSTQKGMYAQIRENNSVELAVPANNYSKVVRITGKAFIDDEMEIKQKLMEAMPALKGLYGSAENPIFTAIYIKPESARIWSFTEDRTVSM